MSKYSIILPVYNGGEYVKECVNSILSQTLDNFNLIVLDNLSTDGTRQWLESLQENRIIIYTSDKPLTIEQNWARITGIPKNEFITLIGHDDILAPSYLEIIDELIKKHPKASLYQTHFTYINSKGIKIRSCKQMDETESIDTFLEKILTHNIDIMGTGFMMRSEDYDKLGGIPLYPNLLFSDFALWCNLTKINYKATAPEECFSFRLHNSTNTTSPALKLCTAFEQFIYFLKDFKKDDNLNDVIEKHAESFLLYWCKGIAHRLLREPKSKRDNLLVSTFIEKCKAYASMLTPDNTFNPTSNRSILLAKIIDSNFITRSGFRLFKKIYGKPVMH